RYNVSLTELARPAPPPTAPPYHLAPITAPKPAEPLTESQLSQRLSQRRETLRVAHEQAGRLREEVARAREVVTRAATEHHQATSALAALNEHHRAEVLNLETALRQGKPPPDPVQNGVDRSYIEERVNLTEATLDKFHRELAEANSRLSDALGSVKAAALAVT